MKNPAADVISFGLAAAAAAERAEAAALPYRSPTPDVSASITLAPAGSHEGRHAQPAAIPEPPAAADPEPAPVSRFLRGIAAMGARLRANGVPRTRQLRCDPLPVPPPVLDRRPHLAAARHTHLPAGQAVAAAWADVAVPVFGAAVRGGADRPADPAHGPAAGAFHDRTTPRPGGTAVQQPGRPGSRPPRPQTHNLCERCAPCPCPAGDTVTRAPCVATAVSSDTEDSPSSPAHSEITAGTLSLPTTGALRPVRLCKLPDCRRPAGYGVATPNVCPGSPHCCG